jgi:catalase-peroxidase
VNNPQELSKAIAALEKVQKDFNESLTGNKKVSFADVVVLGGSVAIEKAASDAGMKISVPFKLGRADATQDQTDVDSFGYLEPKADAFRNFYSEESILPPLQMMVDKANLLTLTVPEMTVLMGGMRALGANSEGNEHGYFTDRPGVLTNYFFVNLLDMSTEWKKSSKSDGLYEGYDRKSGDLKWTATPVDLIFGSHSELRAVAEVYAADDGAEKFVRDFVDAWTKVMNLDRFDLK